MYEINKYLESVHHLIWNNWLFGKVALLPTSVHTQLSPLQSLNKRTKI